MDKTVVLKPRLSEKAYALSEELNTYIFGVSANLSRLSIAKAVAAQYGVTVESVKVAAQPGKTKRTYRRRGRVVYRGRTSAIRKAYVRLKEGDKIPIFSATEESAKSEEEKK
jgi:large subunit ribosomal protein L23